MTIARVERTIAAPPSRVYRAWLDPATLNDWAAPEGFVARDASVDERVGGHYRATHVDADGNHMGGFEATILELVPDERIVLAWEFVGLGRESLGADTRSRLTVTLEPAPDGATRLTLIHDRLDGLEALRPDIARGTTAGWTGTVDRLAGMLRG